MHPSDWRELLSRLPAHLRRLGAPASLQRLREVEARLGIDLPAGYRSFLAAADGGWVGDVRIYGTRELDLLLQRPPVAFRIPRQGPVGRRRDGWTQGRRRLLPFHPVDRFGVECLDLDRAGGPVVWCSDADRTLVPAAGPIDGVHRLAIRIVRWGGGSEPEMRDTYVDFLDWVLDAILGLRFGEPAGIGAGG